MLKINPLTKQKSISLMIKYPILDNLFRYRFIVLINSLVFTPIPSKKAIIKRIVLLLIFSFNSNVIVKIIFIIG